MTADSSRPSSPRARRRFRDTAIASGLLTAAELDEAESFVGPPTGGAAAGGDTPAAVEARDKAIADLLVERSQLTRFQADQMLLGRGRLTLGQYVIVDQVGHGGMGQVFKAKHRMMGRFVAVKVLPKAKWTTETEAAFRREIEMLGRLDHENLVHAHDANFDAGVYYLVTEIVPGLDLRRHVRRYGPLDEVMAASVISQAARGLAYAHAIGVVHRDVKPGNILVRDDGRVKVSDLGLAGTVFDVGEEGGPRRISGTMDYMAPEQIRHPERIHPSADIYSLGCTLYFAVTGKVPFPDGTREEKAKRHLSAEPAPIRELAPQVSPPFAQVVAAMMRKDPRERVASAEAVIEMLRPWTPAEPVAMFRPAVSNRRSSRKSSGGTASGEQQNGSTVSDRQASSTSDTGSSEALFDDGRLPGESSFGSGQTPPNWTLGIPDDGSETVPPIVHRSRGRSPLAWLSGAMGTLLDGLDRRVNAVARVVARSAVVGFVFGLAVALLQAVFGPAWNSLGLSRLDFWSAGVGAFLVMAIVLGLLSVFGLDQPGETL